MINEAERGMAQQFDLAPTTLKKVDEFMKREKETHEKLLLMIEEAKKKHRENKNRQDDTCS